MKKLLSKKTFGTYLVLAAVAAAVISLVRFLMWAPSRQAMDSLLVAALALGIICDAALILKDNDYLIILSTACYSFGLFRLLADSVGSFVDAFQGINMFGDASQVATIISISIVMAVSVILSITASFLKREKE